MAESVFTFHNKEAPIVVYIPFTGSEKKCWDCGLNRELLLRLDINGNMVSYAECCYNS